MKVKNESAKFTDLFISLNWWKTDPWIIHSNFSPHTIRILEVNFWRYFYFQINQKNMPTSDEYRIKSCVLCNST